MSYAFSLIMWDFRKLWLGYNYVNHKLIFLSIPFQPFPEKWNYGLWPIFRLRYICTRENFHCLYNFNKFPWNRTWTLWCYSPGMRWCSIVCRACNTQNISTSTKRKIYKYTQQYILRAIWVGSGKEASNITSTAHHYSTLLSRHSQNVFIRHLLFGTMVRTNMLTPITLCVGAVSYILSHLIIKTDNREMVLVTIDFETFPLIIWTF